MGRGRGHVPIRTCIVCRAKKNKGEMIRLVLDPSGRVRGDDRGGLPGRGAYVCPSCSEEAGKGGRLERAFKKKVIR